ncbi:MAG: ATP-binding protein [Bacteroidia bacterium]|nr:ATP-binding protein [Bacteroidia bacterium]
MNLIKYNRHWESDYFYPFPKKRKHFEVLVEHLEKKQITELVGLRRTGKTTLLFQLINELKKKEIDPLQIWYFTYDENKINIEDLIFEFSRQTKVNYKEKKIYIFLDEIQKLDDFQSQLKVYFDLYPELKFFISGSTSLFIKRKTQESLAGRIFSILIKPLCFEEYLIFSEKESLLKNREIYTLEIEKEYENYWQNQFIETINMRIESDRRQYLTSIIKKIIYEDIPMVFSVENPEILFSIIKIIAQNPGYYLNYDNLGNDLQISSKTISKYISILEQSFLIKILYNYSRNQLSSEKKLKRVYLSSVSFCIALSDNVQKGSMAENAILSVKDYNFFWLDAYKHEVDFIETGNEKIIPIEIKYKSELKNNELQNLFLFTNKFNINNAVVMMKNPTSDFIEYKGLRIETKNIFLIRC